LGLFDGVEEEFRTSSHPRKNLYVKVNFNTDASNQKMHEIAQGLINIGFSAIAFSFTGLNDSIFILMETDKLKQWLLRHLNKVARKTRGTSVEASNNDIDSEPKPTFGGMRRGFSS